MSVERDPPLPANPNYDPNYDPNYSKKDWHPPPSAPLAPEGLLTPSDSNQNQKPVRNITRDDFLLKFIKGSKFSGFSIKNAFINFMHNVSSFFSKNPLFSLDHKVLKALGKIRNEASKAPDQPELHGKIEELKNVILGIPEGTEGKSKISQSECTYLKAFFNESTDMDTSMRSYLLLAKANNSSSQRAIERLKTILQDKIPTITASHSPIPQRLRDESAKLQEKLSEDNSNTHDSIEQVYHEMQSLKDRVSNYSKKHSQLLAANDQRSRDIPGAKAKYYGLLKPPEDKEITQEASEALLSIFDKELDQISSENTPAALGVEIQRLKGRVQSYDLSDASKLKELDDDISRVKERVSSFNDKSLNLDKALQLKSDGKLTKAAAQLHTILAECKNSLPEDREISEKAVKRLTSILEENRSQLDQNAVKNILMDIVLRSATPPENYKLELKEILDSEKENKPLMGDELESYLTIVGVDIFLRDNAYNPLYIIENTSNDFLFHNSEILQVLKAISIAYPELNIARDLFKGKKPPLEGFPETLEFPYNSPFFVTLTLELFKLGIATPNLLKEEGGNPSWLEDSNPHRDIRGNEHLFFKGVKRSSLSDSIKFQVMGDCYRLGIGFKRKGSEEALDSKAGNLYKQVSSSETLDSSAKKGKAESQYKLALRFKDSDPEKAFAYFKAAADQGHHLAQYETALRFQSGVGTTKDSEASFKYFKAAAKQGHTDAQYETALCYNKGLGTTVNPDKAYFFFKAAALSGHTNAEFEFGLREINSETAQKRLAGLNFLKKAADKGHAEAQYKFARSLSAGLFVRGCKGPENAFKYYKLAADNGKSITDAKYQVAKSYEEGIGTEINPSEAFKYYEKAMEEGDLEAKYRLALCYENGLGIDENPVLAFKHYKEAAKKGHMGAKFKTGLFHEEGKDTAKRLDKALKYYNQIIDKIPKLTKPTRLESHALLNAALILYNQDRPEDHQKAYDYFMRLRHGNFDRATSNSYLGKVHFTLALMVINKKGMKIDRTNKSSIIYNHVRNAYRLGYPDAMAYAEKHRLRFYQ
jgi:TPR repeat protein